MARTIHRAIGQGLLAAAVAFAFGQPAKALASPSESPESDLAEETPAVDESEPEIEPEPDPLEESERDATEPVPDTTKDEPEPEPRPAVAPPPKPAPLAPAPAVEPLSPVRVRPLLDLTITVGIAAPTAALGLWVTPSLSNEVPAPGTEANVGRLDRVALGRYSTAPNVAADVLVSVAIAAPLTYHAIEAALRRRGWSTVRGRGFLVRYGTDALIIAQSMAINTFVTQLFKSSIRRPRPYAYLDPAEVDPRYRESLMNAQASHQVDRSFPSGHTSTAFAVGTAGATLLTLDLLGRSRWPIAVSWAGGMALAGTVGTLRVVSGKHYPSDVITGALIGLASGSAVPLAHWRPPRFGDMSRRRGPPRWTVLPQTGPDFVGLTIVGRPSGGGLTRGVRR